MSDFSVTYAGLMDAEEQLYLAIQCLQDACATLFIAANKVADVPSLSDKGYARKIRLCTQNTEMTVKELGRSRTGLGLIAQRYSSAEKHVLQTLSDQAASGNLSEKSSEYIDKAIESHQTPTVHNSVGRTIDEVLYDEEASDAIERGRYWRSTTGSDMVRKAVKATLGESGMDSYVVKEAIDDLNTFVEGWEDISYALLHPLNQDARFAGYSALAGMTGLGGFAAELPRYTKMGNAISDRVAQINAEGHPAKAVAYGMAASTLEFVQLTGDSVYNASKFLTKQHIGKIFDAEKGGKLRKNASKTSRKDYARRTRGLKAASEVNDKAVGFTTDVLEGWFTDAGDWCWSRLDSAFGL